MENKSSFGGIFWYNPEPAIGSEIRKIRPCVIISPDSMNKNLKSVVIVPMTSTIQSWPFRLTINQSGQKSSLACDQIRSIDKCRLKGFIGNIKPADKTKLLNLLQTIFTEIPSKI